jgi:hypothetical protein
MWRILSIFALIGICADADAQDCGLEILDELEGIQISSGPLKIEKLGSEEILIIGEFGLILGEKTKTSSSLRRHLGKPLDAWLSSKGNKEFEIEPMSVKVVAIRNSTPWNAVQAYDLGPQEGTALALGRCAAERINNQRYPATDFLFTFAGGDS